MKKTTHILQAPSPSNLYPPLLTLPPPPPPLFLLHTNRILIVISVLAGAFVLSCYCTIIAKEYRNRRRFTVPINNIQEDHDQSQNPTIQYVSRSDGLEESLIDSITMSKYKSGDSLVEGTECSICLNEFCEDEDLRILPNCTHAFHTSCIDTWLKSNVNCPLCRKNVVSVSMSNRSRDPNSCSSDSEDETHVRNSPQGGVNRRCGNVDASATGESSSPQLRSGFWLQSDLGAVEVTNDDAELLRISDSAADSSALSMISMEDPSN